MSAKAILSPTTLSFRLADESTGTRQIYPQIRSLTVPRFNHSKDSVVPYSVFKKPVSLLSKDFVDAHSGVQSFTSDPRENLRNPLIGRARSVMQNPANGSMCHSLGLAFHMPLFRFGEFELDEQTLELRRKGATIRVQQQPARVLAFLLSHQGKLVTRQQIQDAIWGQDTFVEFEQSLNFCIRQADF
jgi:hypothetical protein